MAYVIDVEGNTKELGDNPSLEVCQEAVGGLVEPIYNWDVEGNMALVNEEGVLLGLPLNPVSVILGYPLMGPVIVLGDKDTNWL